MKKFQIWLKEIDFQQKILIMIIKTFYKNYKIVRTIIYQKFKKNNKYYNILRLLKTLFLYKKFEYFTKILIKFNINNL